MKTETASRSGQYFTVVYRIGKSLFSCTVYAKSSGDAVQKFETLNAENERVVVRVETAK